ncbi:extensin-like [Lathyrus oleraceus]|uniref:extensin-like n=1 Tax=Pisum sativum TaxID=3888 RepID=UPI0021D0D435|nr:extensin-like [Pisum sativum]
MYYLDDLHKQGVEFSDFSLDWLPEFPPDFTKRTREPSEKAKQPKREKLGESSGSRPLVPLVGSHGKSVPLPPSVTVKPIASSFPQPSPIYTNSETPLSTSRPSNQPSQKFNLTTTSLPISEAEMLNETTSPSSSSSLESPPYYTLSSDTEPSDPHSPTLAQLQHRALASQQPTQSIPEPEITSLPIENPNTTTSEHPPSKPIHSESLPQNFEIPQTTTSADLQTPTLNLSPPTSPPQASELENTLLTLEEAIKVFLEASVDKVKSRTINFGISDDPSAVRTH